MSVKEGLERVESAIKERATLIAVSKNQPLEAILEAYAVGCRDFGENRVQEALPKIEAAPDDIRWHLIGSLQRKKVPQVIGKFALIHSVDSVALAEKIATCSDKAGLQTSILLQVNTSGEETKQGFSPAELKSSFSDLASLKGLNIQGLMTMAPLSEDENVIRAAFRGLRELRDDLEGKARLPDLSMGMSQDYLIGIDEGATLVRVGRAIFHS